MVETVRLEAVSKRYTLGERPDTAREAIVAAARRPLRRRRAPDLDLWALREVSFAIGEGDAVGIVGPNGAGKSTILKLIARITSPSQGVVRTRGRVAPLLEVGTGFHRELTGRENVYLNGAILGMSRRDIARHFEAIVDFAGVGRMLDTPVKRYSSGLHLRLAFAIAAHLEPDILVVDEVLAVGDAEFQRKCIGRLSEAEHAGRTVLFVSHDLLAVAQLCPRSLWLDAGEVRQDGVSRDVVRSYLSSAAGSPGAPAASITRGPVRLNAVRVTHKNPGANNTLLRDEPLRIDVSFELADPVNGFDIAVYVTTASGVRVFDEAASDQATLQLPAGRHVATLRLPVVLNVGDYTVGVWFGTQNTELLEQPVAAAFTLHGSDLGRPARVVVLNLPISVQPEQAPGAPDD